MNNENENININEPKKEKHNYFLYAFLIIGLLYIAISRRWDILLYAASVCISFTLVVLIHEGGHFIAARAAGMKVNEFAIGMGPIIYKFGKGETLYTIRAFPIGGFIRPEGEDEDSNDPRAFNNRPLLGRAATVAAGPISNFVLSFLIIIGLIIFAGVPSIKIENNLMNPDNNIIFNNGDIVKSINNKKVFLMDEFYESLSDVKGNEILVNVMRDNKELQIKIPSIYSNILDKNVAQINSVIINEVMPNSPASKIDLKSGDLITKINNQNLYVPDEMLKIVSDSNGEELLLNVVRNGEQLNYTVTPEYLQQEQRHLIGITFKPFFSSDFYKYSYSENIENSILYSGELINQLGSSIKKLVTLDMTKEEVGGPVKIISITVQVTKLGVYPFIHFIALLSLSLGIFNLFPLPALDGGRLVFFAIEAIRGKPVSQKIEGTVHFIGFLMLMLLLLFVTYNDILSLI